MWPAGKNCGLDVNMTHYTHKLVHFVGCGAFSHARSHVVAHELLHAVTSSFQPIGSPAGMRSLVIRDQAVGATVLQKTSYLLPSLETVLASPTSPSLAAGEGEREGIERETAFILGFQEVYRYVVVRM